MMLPTSVSSCPSLVLLVEQDNSMSAPQSMTVTATDSALELIDTLKGQHGPQLLFHQAAVDQQKDEV